MRRNLLYVLCGLLGFSPAFMFPMIGLRNHPMESSVMEGIAETVLVDSTSFAEQVTDINTTYVIRKDFDLGGETVRIPEGCELRFEGGSLRNGSLVGKGTRINTEVDYRIFDNIVFQGFELPYIDIRWVGGVSDFDENTLTGTDSAPAFSRAIDLIGRFYPGMAIRVVGRYLIASPIITEYDVNIFGYHNNSRRLLAAIPEPSSPSLLFVAKGVTAIKMDGQGKDSKAANFSLHNLKIRGASASCFVEYTASGAPGRVSVIEECEFQGLGYCLKLSNAGRDTMLGNLTVDKCNVWYCDKFIAAYSQGNNRTFTNLLVENCNIEQGGSEQLHLENVFGPIIIRNNIIEGLPSPIFISAISAEIRIEDNYFEALTGDAIRVASKNMNTDLFLGGNFYDSSIRFNLSLCRVFDLDFGHCAPESAFRMCTMDESCVNFSSFKLSWISLYCLFNPDQMTGVIPSKTYPLIDKTVGHYLARTCGTSYNEYAAQTYDSIPADSDADCFAFIVDGSTLSIGLGVNGSAVYNTVYTRKKACLVYRQKPYAKGRNSLYIKGTDGACAIGVPQFISIDTGSLADIRLATTDNMIPCQSAGRPTIEKPVGYSIFDTGLKKALYWDGSSWVDAGGRLID